MKFTLARLIASREKNAPGFKVLAFALALSVFSVTVIFNLTNGLKTLLVRDASQLLGADLILESPDPINPKTQELAKEKNLKITNLVDFFSMIMVEPKMELATISAIKGYYPLRGKLKINTSSVVIEGV